MLEAGQVSSKVPQKKSNQIKSNQMYGVGKGEKDEKKKSLNKKNPLKNPKQEAKKLEANNN